MRKWLVLLGLLAAVLLIRKLVSVGGAKSPLRQRISQTVTIAAWVMLTAYGAVFLYWLVTSIF